MGCGMRRAGHPIGRRGSTSEALSRVARDVHRPAPPRLLQQRFVYNVRNFGGAGARGIGCMRLVSGAAMV